MATVIHQQQEPNDFVLEHTVTFTGDSFTYYYRLDKKVLTTMKKEQDVSHFTFSFACPNNLEWITNASWNGAILSPEQKDNGIKYDIVSWEGNALEFSFTSLYVPTESIISVKSGAGKSGSQLQTEYGIWMPGCEIIPEPSSAMMCLLMGAILLWQRVGH
jgi:hypothetical protein